MAIGKTSTTRNHPNTADEFSFWLHPDVNINPTDIVEVRLSPPLEGSSQEQVISEGNGVGSVESESALASAEREETYREVGAMDNQSPQEEPQPDEIVGAAGAPDSETAPEYVQATTSTLQENRTFGLVARIENISDSESHLDNFISHDFGDVNCTPRTQRVDTNVARCVVMYNTRNIYMPVPGGRDVDFADEKGILTALGVMELAITDPDFLPLPAGVIELSNGTKCPAVIDARYLIGPEGAHMNISGISGLASKTSYAIFLINMIMQAYGNDVAVIIFNVKHEDLLYIDKPSDSQLNAEQSALWQTLSRTFELVGKPQRPIQPKPFENVKYFLPRSRPGGANSAGYRSDSNIYAYSLMDICDKISYLFEQVEDPKGNLEALIADVQDDLQRGRDHLSGCETFEQLSSRLSRLAEETKSKSYHGHHPATMRSFIKHFRYFTQSGTTGLFVNNRDSGEVLLSDYVKTIREGQVYVIDIYKLRDYERSFVVADVVREVYRLFSREVTYGEIPLEMRGSEDGKDEKDRKDENEIVEPPKHLLFFIDELNKYAPRSAKVSPVVQNMLEITERGRSLGISLIGAEQFASGVHPRVIGNCSNKAYGRSDSTELSDEAYRHIPTDLKALITRLDQGTLLLQHPIYRQPVRIRFPRPVYYQPKARLRATVAAAGSDSSQQDSPADRAPAQQEVSSNG